MDPITAAIVAGLAAGATKVSTGVLVDAYNGLKTLLKARFGAESGVAAAVASLETKPDSSARQGVLQEEVASAKAAEDPEILAAAKALLDQVTAQPGGARYIQTVSGSGAAAADHGVAAGARGIAIGGNVAGGIERPPADPGPRDSR